MVVGIETDRGPWVQALIAAGLPGVSRSTRCRRPGTGSGTACPGPRATPADAHVLADMVRTDRHQLRPVAGDSAEAEAVKVVARAHKTLIWERTRHLLRLRHALREYFPAALVAFDDLDRRRRAGAAGRGPRPGRRRRR